MKNGKIWLVVGIVALMILINMPTDKKEGISASIYDWMCPLGRGSTIVNMDNNSCYTPCVAVDDPLKSCLTACGFSTTVQYTVFNLDSTDGTCQYVYDNNVPDPYQCYLNCMFGGYQFTTSCSETSGYDVYVKGTYSNAYGVTVEDTCSGTGVYEFYCVNGYIVGEYIDCPAGNDCSNGACGGGTCDNAADTNSDCTLTLSEVIAYAELWVAQSGPTLSQVISTAELWVAGGTY